MDCADERIVDETDHVDLNGDGRGISRKRNLKEFLERGIASEEFEGDSKEEFLVPHRVFGASWIVLVNPC